MIDQYMLRYFLAVAETGNFSRAAKTVSVTQPTLSAGIAKLERQVGARLFERDRQGASLTAAGSRFLVHARRILDEYELALQNIQDVPDPRVLRVGVLHTIPTETVEKIVFQHHRSGSGELVELLDGNERDLAERLDRGRLDIALTVIRPHYGRFRPEVLAAERYMMVLPQDNPLADADEVEAEQLAEFRMVVRRHCEALPEISRFFTEHGVRPRFVLKTTSDQRTLSIVRTGAGIGMMPECFHDPMVRFVRVRDFELRRQVGLLYGEGASALRQGSSPFIGLVRDHYGKA